MNQSVEESNYKNEGVGTLFFNLTKISSKIWPYLVKEEIKYPIWWEMKGNFEKDMDKYIKLIEKIEDEKEELKEREKKKKNRKKPN